MIPNRDWLSTYELMHKGAILMGNNTSCKVTCIGTVLMSILNTHFIPMFCLGFSSFMI